MHVESKLAFSLNAKLKRLTIEKVIKSWNTLQKSRRNENKRKMIDMCKRNLITKDSREDRRIPLRLQAINRLWYWMLDNFHTPFKFVRHRLKKEIWKEKKIYIWSGEREREKKRGLIGGI